MKTIVSTILALVLCPVLCQAQGVDSGPLPPPIVTGNSVEICLNSRYSQHSLGGTANTQQISNILWAAGKAPVTGSYRNIYVSTPAGTYLYDPNSHSLSRHSDDVRDDGAFAIIYDSGLDFDSGVSSMAALLESVSLCKSTESPVANCPKGIGYPKARLIFGVQAVTGLTAELAVHSSAAEGAPGWLPDPHTTGGNSLEEVLGNLHYGSSFAQTNLTLQQISQILWAGYGCTDHTASGRAGLTVPSAWATYYLTRSIYLANENGVFRYHNRNPGTNLSSRDHRIEQIDSSSAGRGGTRPADARGRLQSVVGGLPRAPCYVILCLDSSYVAQEYARLETGFVAGNMLIQATANGLGCYFNTMLTPSEQKSIREATNIPASHVPQAIVSIGLVEVPVSIAVALQGNGRPEAGWVVPITIRFFAPGDDVLDGTAIYHFKLTTAKSPAGSTATCEAPGVALGTYDITVRGEYTLTNARRGVVVSAPGTSVDLGTLLEGDANQDNRIDLDDYAVLAMNWLASKSQAEDNISADFDRDDLISAADLWLLAANWLRKSPVEVMP